MSRPTLTLLHTADVHIGENYEAAQRLEGLVAVVDAASAQRVDALIIAGDLFDGPDIAAADGAAALAQLARLDVPTIVVPGNHDSLAEPSIYDRLDVRDAGAHCHLMRESEGSYLSFAELGLTVWARATVRHDRDHRPLAGYEPGPEGNWQIVVAHGYHVPTGERSDRSSPIRAEEIAGLRCDYLALGHGHRFLDVSSDRVTAFYSGAPSGGAGHEASANLVTLDAAAGVQVRRLSLA